MSKPIAVALVLSAVSGCGASTPHANSPNGSGSAVPEPGAATPPAIPAERVGAEETQHDSALRERAQAQEVQATALAMPTECATAGAKICTPPSTFVERLCQAKSPDLALSMFGKNTPWTRAYLRRDTDAWYMGARRSSPVKLVIDEEVIVVETRSGASGGIQVSGSSSYDVYRWDGQCVSVMSDEVSLRRPSVPRSAPIVWKSLNDATHAALLDDRGIKSRQEQQRDRCNEDSSTARCTEATAALTRLITEYVRRGGKLQDARLAAHSTPAR